MSEGQVYKVTASDTLFDKRVIVRYARQDKRLLNQPENRVFVPFSGFDGQALAGSGALVFEGELLDLQR